jgi:hypothetical protein
LTGGNYTVSGTDSDSLGDSGTWSFTLTVTASPVVTGQPTGDTVTTGATASFTASASGYPTPTVQWQVSENDGSSWSNLSGATSTTYSFTAWSPENGYEYEAVFTNSVGSATTNPATLTVGPTFSYNWSGFVETGGTFTAVSGRWTVPTVTCTSGETAYSAAWIGIDGDGSSTVEQNGTDSDCNNGTPSYYAWFEFYAESGSPVNNGDEENIAKLDPSDTVSNGDVMSASVSVTSNDWTLMISDTTKGWAYTEGPISWTAPQKASAEWIAERPEVCDPGCALTSLADFGSVTFTDATATDNGTSGPISAFSASAMEMFNNAKTTVLAAPGPLDSTGEDFTDDWFATGP